jgi:hypothetical protein
LSLLLLAHFPRFLLPDQPLLLLDPPPVLLPLRPLPLLRSPLSGILVNT